MMLMLDAETLVEFDDVLRITGRTSTQLHRMMDRKQFPRGQYVPGLGFRWRGKSLLKWLEENDRENVFE